jgi:hypothetical protein
MKSWTPDASEYFEDWLGRVRTSVATDPTLDAEDITQDLRAHVHAELAAIPEPVTKGQVERVLDSLGNPTQWSDSVKPPPKPPTVRFYTGASDTVSEWQEKLAGEWGLPVLLVVLTVIAIPTFDDVIGVPLIVFCYFVARSKVNYTPQPLEGAKRWMVYFPLAIGAGLLTGLVLGFPLTFLGSGGGQQFQSMWALGSWWIIVGLLSSREPKLVRSALRPFADGFESSHGRTLALIGVAFLIAATVIMIAD